MEDKREVLLLKNNLEAYKLLNRDLSKKVQELKLYLNQQCQILDVTKHELMQERINNAKYKHFIKTNITLCSQFYDSVLNNLNECIVTTDLDVTISDPNTNLVNAETDQAGPSVRVNPKTSKIHQINMLSKTNAKDRDDILYTIDEDQMSLSTITIGDVQRTEITNESNPSSYRISTPNTSTYPALQDFQNITNIPVEQIHNIEQSTPPLCRQDTPSTSNSSSNLSFNSNQDTPRRSNKRDSKGPRRLSSSENEPAKKMKSVSLELLAVSLTENQLQEYLDKYNSDHEDDCVDHDESINSIPLSSATSTSKASPASSSKRKKNAKVEPVKRKSRGRPKRKATLNICLAEKSCRAKLRRSK